MITSKAVNTKHVQPSADDIAPAISRYITHVQGLFDDGTVVEADTGRRFIKIVTQTQWQRRVHAFIEIATGDLYKAATFKAPAKGVRYNLVADWDILQWKIDRYGSYLYYPSHDPRSDPYLG
jgi:hypothetical protein